MSKGSDTRNSILREALDLSSEVGLEGLSVGSLARRVGMSKSGLYAHFESKEDLQCQVLNSAAELFAGKVVTKVLKRPRGLPRVRALFNLWLDWASEELSGGCPFISGATEFDDRSGPVRETLVAHLDNVTAFLSRAVQIAIDEGHFRKNLDPGQFAFDFWAIQLSYHQLSRLMRQGDARRRAKRAFTRLIQDAERE